MMSEYLVGAFVVTVDWINRNATPAGGYKNEQLKAIGVPIPPMRGWARKASGKLITEEQKLKFEAFHHGYKATAKSKNVLGIDPDAEVCQEPKQKQTAARAYLEAMGFNEKRNVCECNKWVSTDTRFPTKEEQPCLIAVWTDGVKAISSEIHAVHNVDGKGVWYSAKTGVISSFQENEAPTHWMSVPLPSIS